MRRLAPPVLCPTPYHNPMVMPEALVLGPTQTQYSSSTWFPGANVAIYIPISVPVDSRLESVILLCANATGNYDLGLYDENYVRIGSKGSTAAANATLSYALDFFLKAGKTYFMAAACNNTGTGIYRMALGSAQEDEAIGIYEEASAFPLPATMTPVPANNNYFPLMGLTLR